MSRDDSEAVFTTFVTGPMGLKIDSSRVVASVTPGSQAEVQGVRPGYQVVGVGGEDVSQAGFEQVISLIKSSKRPLAITFSKRRQVLPAGTGGQSSKSLSIDVTTRLTSAAGIMKSALADVGGNRIAVPVQALCSTKLGVLKQTVAQTTQTMHEIRSNSSDLRRRLKQHNQRTQSIIDLRAKQELAARVLGASLAELDSCIAKLATIRSRRHTPPSCPSS